VPAVPTPADVRETLITAEELRERVADLGARITVDYAGRDLVLVTVLKGGLFFLADLCRAIDLPLAFDFMSISTYGPAAVTGEVRITKDLDERIGGRAVLVIEDIIDTGLTLNYLLGVLRSRDPASLEVCVLLDKDVRRIVDLPIAYRGFSIPDSWVVGYGLDHRQVLRNLPYIGILSEEALS
jgi:hypoxanthine phosphoribosyltransferase